MATSGDDANRPSDGPSTSPAAEVPKANESSQGALEPSAVESHQSTVALTASPLGNTSMPGLAVTGEAATPQFTIPFPLTAGLQLGRYHIVRLLGQGGMGAVYLARDSELDRFVALKVPRITERSSSELLVRFAREARAAATLRHPHVCPVYDVGEIQGVHFLTMAYIDGQPLSQLLRNAPELSQQQAVDWIRKIAWALEEAHQAGVVHRDLKPGNVMIDQRGEPIVTDFGLARRAGSQDAELTRIGSAIGTPAYMSPEQVMGDPAAITASSDIYSLGVIFYQLLTGRLPFEGDLIAAMGAILWQEPKPPSDICADVDAELELICLKAIAKAPQNRFASMRELAAALDAWDAERDNTVKLQRMAARPAVVRGFQHDLFVSYAHVDDQPAPGFEEGWVTALVKNLEWRLRQLCSRTDGISVWMEPHLAREPRFTPDHASRLQESASIIIINSPAYLSSAWCGPQSNSFLPLLSDRIAQGASVLLVERDRVDDLKRPEILQSLRRRVFWEPQADGTAMILGYPSPNPQTDKQYYARIDDLARELHAAFERLNSSAPSATPRPSTPSTFEPSSATASIYLAEVTDDLDALRDEVERYLDQCGYEVFPKKWYSRDASEFQSAMQEELQGCLVFVQLLGNVAGKKAPGSTSSYGGLQYACALQSAKRIMQWRAPDLDPQRATDADQRQLLTGDFVRAIDLEDFKRDVVSYIRGELARRRSQQADEPRRDQPFVFINVDRADVPLAQDLGELLEQSGFWYALPMHEGKPDQIRQDLEANLLDCDGLMVVYGNTTEQWVREQLRQWRKVLYRRDKQLRALAVYEGPPAEKHPLGMKLPKMFVIDCRHGLHTEHVREFLQRLSE